MLVVVSALVGCSRGSNPPEKAKAVVPVRKESARPSESTLADVNARDTKQNTPLHDAENPAIMELLIEDGADVNARGYYGMTPLFPPVRAGREDCVKLLLEHGADPNRKEMYEGRTPLHTVALTHDREIAALLLRHGAEVNATDRRGNTPLKLLLGYHDFDSYEGREATEKVLREWGGVGCPHR
jgi:ankyrin repeat protein